MSIIKSIHVYKNGRIRPRRRAPLYRGAGIIGKKLRTIIPKPGEVVNCFIVKICKRYKKGILGSLSVKLYVFIGYGLAINLE